jgi:mono/diheme cytochrome c family protein
MIRRFWPCIATAALAALAFADASGASAQDAREGRRLAEQWCIGCHVIGPRGPGGDRGPAFATVAKDPRSTPARLRAWLADPHPPMVNPGLSNAEIASIIAYIESLRGS